MFASDELHVALSNLVLAVASARFAVILFGIQIVCIKACAECTVQ